METEMASNIYELFPFFLELKEDNSEEPLYVAKKIAKRTKVFDEGTSCGSVAFVLKGTIRVSKIGRNGREVILYRVRSGDSCILTISSVLSNISYPATATVEEDAEVVLVTVQQFKTYMEKSAKLQQYTYKLLAERFIEVMTLVDEIIFRKIDERLIEFLLSKTKGNGDIIEMTHDEIAIELGTAREVVSRIIKGLEREGYIQLSRGKVRVVRMALLAAKLSEY